MKSYWIGIILSLCLIAVFPVQSFAQIGVDQEDVNLELIPGIPGANTKVTAKITSYVVNLDSSLVTWVVNNEPIKSEMGLKTFSFKTGDVGTKTVLRIIVKTNDGATIDKIVNIEPASVDIIWESKSLVPPLYKGKALFSHENRITFIAVPHIVEDGREVPAENLIYKWSKNGTVIGEASGYGKNTYSFVGPLISRPFKMEVDVTSANTEARAYNQTSVYPTDPIIVLYKKSPLYGLELQKSVGQTETLTEPEATLVAIPLFFGADTYDDSSLLYRWYINGNQTSDAVNQNTQVFRAQNGAKGSANISLSIENANKILQLAKKSININFDKASTQ